MTYGNFGIALVTGEFKDLRKDAKLLKHNHRSQRGVFVEGCEKCDGLIRSISRTPSPSAPPENQD